MKAPKILMVEDLVAAQKIAADLFKKLNFNLDTVSDASSAFEKIILNHYDLIFIDIQLPDINGFEFSKILRQIERKRKRIPIIAITANYMEDLEQRCKNSGIDYFILKPLSLESIRHILLKYLKCDVG